MSLPSAYKRAIEARAKEVIAAQKVEPPEEPPSNATYGPMGKVITVDGKSKDLDITDPTAWNRIK